MLFDGAVGASSVGVGDTIVSIGGGTGALGAGNFGTAVGGAITDGVGGAGLRFGPLAV